MMRNEEQVPDTTQTIIEFLERIGIDVVQRDIEETTFLPGITVESGKLIIDIHKLKYPGDLLHEAGHLATLAPEKRGATTDDFGTDGGDEMVAIAWSYAACLHLNLPLKVVFHDAGYKGDADWLIETFESGSYIGLPLLEWKGMACSQGEKSYPEMISWLCP